jgi:hypothetical protein
MHTNFGLFPSVTLHTNHLLSNQSVTLLSHYLNTLSHIDLHQDHYQSAPLDKNITVANIFIQLSRNFTFFLK